jgi:hypothetical protein
MRKTSLFFQVLFAGLALAMIALTAHALSSSNFVNPDDPSTSAPPPDVQARANQSKPTGQQLILPPGEGVSLRDSEVIPSIGINLSGKMDVALAIGKESFGSGAGFTGTVNYADFENELRKWFNGPGDPPGPFTPGYYLTVPDYYDTPNDELLNWAKGKYGANAPMLPNRDLYIDASQMISLSMSDEFTWWEYDHAPTANIDHSTHKYHEAVGTQSTNSYNNKNPHIEITDQGASMTFFGYGTSGYKDFTYLPHTEATRKVFEFSIQEEEAGHTLDGVGFFFNCNIVGTYGTDQVMNGYLLLLGYTNANIGMGKNITIYKFQGVNTKTLHHTSAGNLSDYNGTFNCAGGSWTIVARSTIYASTQNKMSRHIKIEVDPEYVRMWYKYGVNNPSIINMKFEDLSETDQNAAIIPIGGSTGWALSGGATSVDGVPGGISLDQTYISSYGFGPMVGYRSHGCSQTTKQEFQKLTMSSGSVRKLHEVVADPHWHDNTKRVLVNLNLQDIEDFSTPAMMGDLLSRVINDNIYYIGWCSNENYTQSQQFADASNPAGTLINTVGGGNYTGGNPTTPASRNMQMKKIAQAIYDVWYKGNVDNRVLVTDDVNFTVEPAASGANTGDPNWPDGKWKFVHRTAETQGWDVDLTNPDNTTPHPLSNRRMSNLDIDFTYPGEYDVYYRDVLIKTITAHRKPVAQFSANIGNLSAPVFDDSYSYDPDDLTTGIVDKQWKWTDLTANNSGTGQLASLAADHVYLIELTVEDKWGATATFAKTLKPSAGSGTKEPPMAVFELSPVTVIKGLPGQKIIINDHSYDDYNRNFTYKWSSPTAGLLSQLGISSTWTGGIGNYSVPPGLGVGEYKILLTVTTSDADHQVSLQASRTFWVVEDNTAPAASPDKAAGDVYTGYTTLTLTFDDVPVYDASSQQNVMSGFKQQWVYVSTTPIATPSTITNWGEVSTANNRAVNLPAGKSYVYWKAEDNVGNIGYGEFGEYTVNPFPTVVTLTSDPALSVVYGERDVDLTATLEDSKNPYEPGTIEFFMDGVSLGFADIIRGTGGSGDNIYTAYAMFNATPNHATPPANPLMKFEAKFYGDIIHAPSNASIDHYQVDPNPDAKIDITLTLGAGADSKVYDGVGIPVLNVDVTYPKGGGNSSDFAISYSGDEYGVTPYGPVDAISPVNVGDYTATARTTSPNYEEKTDYVDFHITPRMVTVNVAPPGSPVSTGDAVLFTATIGNLVDQPAGTVTFYLDGAPVETGAQIGTESGGTATATWTWLSAAGGSHDVMAVFVPAAQSNYTTSSHTINGYNVEKAAQSQLYFVYDGTSTPVPDEDAFDSYSGQTLASGIVFGGPDFKVEAAGGLGTGVITYELISQSPFGGTSCIEFNPLTRVAKIKGAGTFFVKATKAGDAQYNAVDTVLLVEIARALGNVTVSVDDVDYLEPVNPVVTNLSGGALTYTYTGTLYDLTTYGPTSTPPTQGGTYTLTVTSAQTANYQTASGTDNFTIHKIPQTIELNHGLDTTLWTTQTTPFTLPVTGGGGTGALTWNSTVPAVATVTSPGGVITLQPGITPPVSTIIEAQKAGDNNYLPSNTSQITLDVVYQPTTVDVGIDALPPDFADATYKWTIMATGFPPYGWSVPNLPAGMVATPSGANGEYLTIGGTPHEVFDDDLIINVTNGGGVTKAVDVPMKVYPAPVASTDDRAYVECYENMVITYPIPMNRNVRGTVTINGRQASGYWLSNGEFVIPPPRDGYEYETTYTVVISSLRDENDAIIQYHQTFIFRTGQMPPPPRISRMVTILPLPAGVTSDPLPEIEHVILSGDDFIFTLTAPAEWEPVIATNRMINGVIETLKGERIDETDSYRFVIQQIRQRVDISVMLKERTEVGNEVTVDGTKIWSYGGILYVETSRAGVLTAYTLTGELRLQQTVSSSAKFTLPRGMYIAKMHGKAYKVMIH